MKYDNRYNANNHIDEKIKTAISELTDQELKEICSKLLDIGEVLDSVIKVHEVDEAELEQVLLDTDMFEIDGTYVKNIGNDEEYLINLCTDDILLQIERDAIIGVGYDNNILRVITNNGSLIDLNLYTLEPLKIKN